MRYEPHKEEVANVPTMSDGELLEYLLYRIFETDEVWTLREGIASVTRVVGDQETLPIWPYKQYAEAAAVGEWADLRAVADSVDYFAYQTLDRVAQRGQIIEIMPRQAEAGCLITPKRLFDMLENMMEARDYTVGD